jgi:hypothetical protein
MRKVVVVLGCVWGLVIALGRLFLIDEMKGWMKGRRDQAVEDAIAALSEEDRALFEEDWRATYGKYADRPLAAWRCAHEFRLSARNLALAEPQKTQASVSDSIAGLRSRLFRQFAESTAFRFERP